MPLSFAGAPFPPDPARLSTANTFTGNQTIVGDISATGVVYASGGNSNTWTGLIQNEVRSDFVEPYTYIGIAPESTEESASLWYIRRSEFTSEGSFVVTLTASNVEWTNRLTISYT